MAILGLGLLIASCTYDNEIDLGIVQPGTITRDQRVIDFQSEVRPIINADCSIPGCHVAEEDLPNFMIDEEVVNEATDISSYVISGEMPIGRTLTFEQKDILISWINQGAELN